MKLQDIRERANLVATDLIANKTAHDLARDTLALLDAVGHKAGDQGTVANVAALRTEKEVLKEEVYLLRAAYRRVVECPTHSDEAHALLEVHDGS